MVAYSFKPSFVGPILSGEKHQTIRLPRKRHARPGEQLQLYTGMRTRACRLIASPVCEAVHDIRLDVEAGEISIDDAVVYSAIVDLNAFAVRDGFGVDRARRAGLSPWAYMRRFWRLTHPDVGVFRGVLIVWKPVAKAAAS